MTERERWRHSESREIRPFRVSDQALRDVGFRMSQATEYSRDNPWSTIVEPHELVPPNFYPSFNLDIDLDRLASDTGINPGELTLFIVARDPAIWRSECIADWPVRELPERYSLSDQQLAMLSGARGLQFDVQITPRDELSPGEGRATQPGQIVGTKTFAIKVPSEGVDFPVQVVPPSHFEDINLPKETVWVIDWHETTDFDQPPENILNVLINEDQGGKLLRLSGQDSLAAVLWREVATEIFVEIAYTMFISDPAPPENADSLLEKMYERIRQTSGKEFQEIVRIAKDPAGLRFLRAHIQVGMELGHKINQINLAGRV